MEAAAPPRGRGYGRGSARRAPSAGRLSAGRDSLERPNTYGGEPTFIAVFLTSNNDYKKWLDGLCFPDGCIWAEGLHGCVAPVKLLFVLFYAAALLC